MVVETAQPDLSDRVPFPRLTDADWAARRALVEYQFLKRPRYQGSGSLLVRADAEAPRPDTAQLWGGLLNDQLAAIAALDGGRAKAPQGKPDEAEQRARREAEAAGFIAVRITRLEQDLAKGQLAVHDRLFARMPRGEWTRYLGSRSRSYRSVRRGWCTRSST